MTAETLGLQQQQLVVGVHTHLRDELAQLRTAVDQVAAGAASAAEARWHLSHMTMRQHYERLGSFCAVVPRACDAIGDPAGLDDVRSAVDDLERRLLAHLADEEEQLLDVIGRTPIEG
ncbi:MAG: hypothetical protein ACLGIV_13590 [Actinomycetes bacterium]